LIDITRVDAEAEVVEASDTEKVEAPNYKHPLRGSWAAMRQRCNNPNHHRYHVYGERGISVFSAWDHRDGFTAFRDWVEETLGPRPSDQHTLDRVNNDGDYEPGNLRWATSLEQNRNTTRQTNPWVLAWIRENYPEVYAEALDALGLSSR
jgi:hypothetical protein